MAPSTPIGAVTDELVASLVPSSTALSKLRKFKETFTRQLRHHNYARTNQFEVAERLDGLQEKFLVLNHDDLADALHARLRELKTAAPFTEQWVPDVLHLLLQLSDDPVRKTKMDDLNKGKTSIEEVQPLRWAEVQAEDPIDRESDLWKNPDYIDLSSDDDIVTASPEPSSPGAPQHDERANEARQEVAYLIDRDLIEDDVEVQAQQKPWDTEVEAEMTFTELQAVRETLFMLQGLPTTLFWRIHHTMEIDKRFHLSHTSSHLSRDVLESFVSIGLRVDSVREWLRRTQTVPVLQSLRVGMNNIVRDFDSCISQVESRLLAPQQLVIISIAKTLEEIIEHSRLVMQLATFVEQLMSSAADSNECLDLLYDTVCACQASGADDLLEPLAHLFLESFEVYLRPVRQWIEFGEVDPFLDYISLNDSTSEKSLPSLWQDWYKLKDDSAPHRAPRLMLPFIRQVFVAGKTMVFLRHLPSAGLGHLSKPPALAIEQMRSLRPSGLIAFSDAFETAIKHMIGDVHRSSSAQLREELGNQCGLWRTLDALHSIFLGKSGWVADAIDARIFERIDQGNRTWHDRYILTELYRNAFQGIESIDTDRITARASRSSSRDMQSQRRSVKMLGDLTPSYTLPRPVANIVSTGAMQSYKHISTFLLQIRRARYVLERRCRVAVMRGRLDVRLCEQHLARTIHRQLLLFMNDLYDHLTLFTIENATAEMRDTLTAAIDVDGMIEAHQGYMSKLEDLCLVSRRVGTIKRAIMILLDLCIRFSDTVTSPSSRRHSVDARSFKSASSRLQIRPGRQGSDQVSSDEDSSSSEEISTFVTFDERSYEGELRDIQQEFDCHRSFIVAGIKSAARVEKQSTGWNILAERLDWKISRKA